MLVYSSCYHLSMQINQVSFFYRPPCVVFFYGINFMATDVDVQYFSHLNGLTLGNNWGDLIRLLDKALVTGLDFTQITAASIDTQGDVHITLYAAHNAMLFQVVELTGFAPSSLNQKYRIKGVPNTTQLILKPALDIVERSITAIGTGKLASLGYDIIFRDAGDVKRVYRTKNPTVEHPFIRVDESLTSPDGTSGVYTSSYAKYAMVGLLENMTHIDDYENPEVLQLPFDSTDPAKNWKITGTGTNVIRGWSKWHWAVNNQYPSNSINESASPNTELKRFTLCGDNNAFYLLNSSHSRNYADDKVLRGCGTFKDCTHNKGWFLMSALTSNHAGEPFRLGTMLGGTPLAYYSSESSSFLVTKESFTTTNHVFATPIIKSNLSGSIDVSPNTDIPALEIPFADTAGYLRGGVYHIFEAYKQVSYLDTTPIISDGSMYIADSCRSYDAAGGFYFYLGELI